MYFSDGELYTDEGELIYSPQDKFAVDKELFAYKNDETGACQVFVDSNPYVDNIYPGFTFLGSVVLPADPELKLAARKAEILERLFKKVDEKAKSLEAGFSTLEKESWAQQEAEAKALLAVKTPLIDALCFARGCSRDYLANRIMENAEAARNAGTYILGWQQNMEERIKKMTLEEFSELWSIIDAK